MRIKSIAILSGICGLLTLSSFAAYEITKLKPYGEFESPLIDESSGIVKSRTLENVYWTHNDSGDQARIFAVDIDGKSLIPEWNKDDYTGLHIADAANIDWEDITTDNSGNLYIAACGNNGNARRDLAIYKLPEPNPLEQIQTRTLKTIPFVYPDQDAFPPALRNFDCEAIFWANNHIYLLTKHRSDTNTKLYRLDTENPHEVNTLTKVSTFDVKARVTGADASPDGKTLAVLTYGNIWIFQKPDESDDYLAHPLRYLQITAKQCEAICWLDPETLLVTNEQKELFRVPLHSIPEYQP